MTNDLTISTVRHPLSWHVRVRWLTLCKYSYLLSNLVKKDVTTKYRRSILGILWSVLNPLLMMGVITTVFSRVFRIQTENYPIYYLTGSLIFTLMSEATSNCLTSILGAAGLIKKVYIPKYVFPLEKCLFALVNSLFSLIAVIIMMPILGMRIPWTALLFWMPMIYELIFCIGLGMILAAGTVYFRDIAHIYSVLVTAWMYLTPILYPIENLPAHVIRYIRFNPMIYYVDMFRMVMMYGQIPSLWMHGVCATFSVGFLLLGLIVFKITQNRFILHI